MGKENERKPSPVHCQHSRGAYSPAPHMEQVIYIIILKTAKIMGITTQLDFKLLMVSQLMKIPKSMYPNSRLLKETTTLTNK